jgi:hypothetical protein
MFFIIVMVVVCLVARQLELPMWAGALFFTAVALCFLDSGKKGVQ